MSGALATACAAIACACAGTAAGCIARNYQTGRARARRREKALGVRRTGERDALTEQSDRVLAYATRLTQRLFSRETEPLTPCVRKKRADKTKAGGRYREKSLKAGCAKTISTAAFCEARTRLAAIGALAGMLLGITLSNELCVLLGVVGAFAGRSLPLRAVNGAVQRRAVEAEMHLSEMLEVVALGLRSGMTFDRSFALYGTHFANDLSRSCTKAYRQWSLGLMTREEALREFAGSYDCEQLGRIVESVIRSLRFGTALAETLEEAAVQARETYRSKLAERVAKAPVKMMLPTGTLILPSMLLLVMGPIVIELISGF